MVEEPLLPKVLVPIDLVAGEETPGAVVEFLSEARVVVLGYHVVPEQTPPGQAREEFGEEQSGRVEREVERFREAGDLNVEGRMVFTPDAEDTLERVADEEEVDAVLIQGELRDREGSLEEVLVPIRGDVNADRILDFTASLAEGREVGVTLLTVVKTGAEEKEGRRLMLEGARSRLVDMGVERGRVEEVFEVSEEPLKRLAELAGEHDLLVMGESEPSVYTLVFGEVPERVAESAGRPTLVVRGGAERGSGGSEE